tara:strand:+ start:43 stop:717 length:675 start_codon:yes stop_codon:yes gene_type:complete
MSELRVTTLQHESAAASNITLDANGRVGIGTSAPAGKLHVFGSSTYTAGIETSSTFAYLGFKASGSGGTMADPNVGIGATVDNLVFRAGGAERMRLDSAGRVTMPYQPAFFVGGTTFTSSSVHYGTPYVNRGSHYSPTTGRFTAPVAGVYTFTFSLTSGNNDSHFINIHINGALVDNNALLYGLQYNTGSTTVILNMNVGDYVDARRRDAMNVYSARFTGHLLG